MIDFEKALLLIVIVLLTTMLTVIGVQIFLILKDLRKLIARTNSLMDQVETKVASLTNPFQNLTGFFDSFRDGVRIFEAVSGMINRKPKTSKVEDYVDNL
jgi:uncharacterized protein YoxC